MKRVLLLGVVLAVALYATVAWAATPPTPTEKKLQKDVATLKAQMKTLKKSVSDLRDVALAVAITGACNTAITADGLQGTWQEIDQLSAATRGQDLLRAADACQRRDPQHQHPLVCVGQRQPLSGPSTDGRAVQRAARPVPNHSREGPLNGRPSRQPRYL